MRCENLEKMTFPDESFDMVITQDVLEHVLDPGAAFREIARVLRKNGLHVFTVPYYPERETVVRTAAVNGEIRHFREAVYHGNPIDEKGSLVTRDWGLDLIRFIRENGGMETAVYNEKDKEYGITGEFRDVFISRKK